MIVSLKVPDETYEIYGQRNPANPRVEMERTLQSFAEVDPKGVSLSLNNEELAVLNALLGHPIGSFAELKEHLQRNMRCGLGEDLEVPLSLGQRIRVKALADAQARDYREYVVQLVKQALTNSIGV